MLDREFALQNEKNSSTSSLDRRISCSIATGYGLTRERVRQIIKRDVQKVRNWYTMKTGTTWFDEDYFRYFYETYDFEKADGIEWFGMTTDICS